MSPRIAIKLVLVMFLWAVCFPLISAGLEYAPHLTFAASRAFLAGAALLVLGAALGRRLPSGGRIWMLIALTGLGATTLAFFSMFHAAEFISPGMATVIANTQSLMAMGAQLMLGGVPLAFLAVLTEAPETMQWATQFALVLVTLALLGTSLVYWLWFSLLESVELNKANAFSFLIPLFGIAMGVVLFGEGFSWPDAVGAGLTVLGLDLVVRSRGNAVAAVQSNRELIRNSAPGRNR